MGFHIDLISEDYNEQYEHWDALRHVDDCDFIEMFEERDKIYPEWNSYGGVFRLKNIDMAKVKLAASNIQNKDRYYKLLSVLKIDSKWWIDYS